MTALKATGPPFCDEKTPRWKGAPQVPFDFAQGRLSAPSGFPVRLSDVVEPLAAFLKESRMRGRWLVQGVGNAESDGMTKGR